MNPVLEYNHPQWNNLIIKMYWISWLATVFISIIDILVNEITIYYLLANIVFPILFHLIFIVTTQYLINMKVKFIDYIVITCGTLIALILIISNSATSSIIGILFLPVVISIFYFQFKKVIFSGVTSFVGYISIVVGHTELREQTTVIGFLVTTIILCTGTYIAVKIMNRGEELVRYTKQITEERQNLLTQNVIMERLSKIDALTELYNHMTFQEYFASLLAQCERNKLSIQLAILDIDNFKKINDVYGHKAGDVVLKKVSRIIKSCISENDFAARYGGEEITIIFVDKTLEQSYLILENIRKMIASTIFEELDNNNITVSAGISSYRSNSKDSLFNDADEALYKAKKSGKNIIVISN